MVNKKVTCYSVNIPESMDFVQLLLDNEESSLKPFVLDQYRTIELKYTQIQKNGSIVGLFVTTSRKNIPPAHKPLRRGLLGTLFLLFGLKSVLF